jgi:lipoic acid synthetase
MPLDIKTRKPSWLKVRPPGGERYRWIKERRRTLQLTTVCEEAQCPNIGECWSSGTATFMVMGSVCTRGCRFCAVNTNRVGKPLDPLEPLKLAETIRAMDLDYIVVTSVDRDDLPDQGAAHFAACVRELRVRSPKTRVEILFPDFRGDLDLVRVVVEAGADVLAHNLETVRRLQKTIRDGRCGYDQSLSVLGAIKDIDPNALSKSSLMVGLGETEPEMISAMRDLRAVGVDFLTVGQYLRPSAKHIGVEEYVDLQQFERYETMGRELGFRYVASGPLVRSSYKAGEFFISNILNTRDRPGFSPSSRRLQVIQ